MSEHHHHHASGKNLFITIILNSIITIAQIIGGIVSGSLALLSDAMHNFSDVLSLVIAYGANRVSSKPSNTEKTFGYHRAEILAALFNSSVLIGISFYLIIEACSKLYHPEPIDSTWVIALGALGIVVNALSVWMVKEDAEENMNLQAAYLHLLADVMTSIAVVIGGVLMYYFHIFWIDPIISILIALYLLWASFGLVKGATFVLMQFVPKGIELSEVVKIITDVPQIENAHHIHLWQLDDHRIHLEAHLDFNENITIEASNKIIDILENQLRVLFKISHVTFQCEYNRCDNKEVVKL
ncbi:MAG: cation diffusion facilitator family transporter [Campylobacterales bacterium]|nr:cation diffusion facilitator family transporter [Campylobacterales bacterium]